MAEYHAGNNVPDQKCSIDNDQTNQSKYQGIVKLLDGPQWTARESKMGVLEIYQFEARMKEPIRDLKGGGCGLHLESDSYCFPELRRPQNFARRCECSCSPPPPCRPDPPCCFPPDPPCCYPSDPPCCYPPDPPCYCPPSPPCPRPVESCLPGLHQKYRDSYSDCKESHLPSGYRNIVEHDDLYLPPRPQSAASNYCNRPTSPRSWSTPSQSPRLKCHCGATQYQSTQVWDKPESKPCFQSFFQASPSPRGSTPKPPSRCDSLYFVDTPPSQPPSRPTTPSQQTQSRPTTPLPQPSSEKKELRTTSCQYSPRIEEIPESKSIQTQKSRCSSPLSPDNLDLTPDISSSRPSSPSSYYPPSKPMGLLSQPQNRRPYAAELVTVKKQVQCNCSPPPEFTEFDGSNTRRVRGNLSVYDSGASIRKVLRPESPLDLARSAMRLECTCQHKPATKSSNQTPAHSSILPARQGHGEADLNMTTFLNEVKRIITSDVPSSVRKQDLKQDYTSSVKPTLKSEFSLREVSATGRSADRKTMLSSMGRITDWQEDLPSTDYSSRIISTLKPAVPKIDFSSARTNRKQESTTRDNFPFSGRVPDWEHEIPSKARAADRKQDWDVPSSGRRKDRQQAEWELPLKARSTDRKQWELPSNLEWEYPSSLRATDRKQKYSTCVRTIERGSSPIIATPTMKESGLYSAKAGIESAGRLTEDYRHDPVPGIPKAAEPKQLPKQQTTEPIVTNSMKGEAANHSRPLEGDHFQRPSTRSPEPNITPPKVSEGDYRYDPVQGIPKAAEPKQLPKRNFNKRDTSSRLPNREVTRRCCCGMCKSTYSRSHFTTKCPFCANVHSCCCGMCSCPIPSCTSKSPIPDSNTSNYTSTTSSPRNGKLPFHNNNHPGFCSSRPKSLSPMKRTYLAGLEMPVEHQQRSKSARSKRKLQQRAFEPSPRALLESFHNYLKSESRRAKAGSSPHRRCSERRSTHWNPPSKYPDQNCSQRAKRLSTPKASKLHHQAPWGTHPILLNPKPPVGQSLEYRLPYSRSHRGCCCQGCVNGKL